MTELELYLFYAFIAALIPLIAHWLSLELYLLYALIAVIMSLIAHKLSLGWPITPWSRAGVAMFVGLVLQAAAGIVAMIIIASLVVYKWWPSGPKTQKEVIWQFFASFIVTIIGWAVSTYRLQNTRYPHN